MLDMLKGLTLPIARVSTKGCKHSGMGELEVKPQLPRSPRSAGGGGGGGGAGTGQASVARITEPSAQVCVAAGGGGGAIGGGGRGGGDGGLPPNAKRMPAE